MRVRKKAKKKKLEKDGIKRCDELKDNDMVRENISV